MRQVPLFVEKQPVQQIILFVQPRQQIMLSFLFKSESSFEASLVEYLNGNPERLSQGKLHNVLSALRGEDPHIKSEIAFATLKKLITAFEFDTNDMRILKQLIILDQLVEQNIFCAEISIVNFFSIESNKESSGNALKENTRRVLRLFWKIIKDKSIIMIQSDHIFHEKRSQRGGYLSKLKPGMILNQIGTIQVFFINIFELIYYFQHPSYMEEREVQEWRRSGITEYIVLHLLYKLFYLYNCQMMIHKYLVSMVEDLSPQEIYKLKRHICKFRDHCNKFINFIKEHQGIKGFENANYEEIRVEVNERLIKFIDQYLHQLQIESNEPLLNKLPINMGRMKVEKKPLTQIGRLNPTPRLVCPQIQRKDSSHAQTNTFLNWQNSYSHEFPQKEVMSVDLIMQIKLEESLNKNCEEQQIGQRRVDNIYLSCCGDNRSTCASSGYGVNFVKIKQYAINVLDNIQFENIYSKVYPKWNS